MINAPWGGVVFHYESLHSAIEAVGAFAAMIMAGFLLQMKAKEYGGRLFLVAMGFLGMGILDCIHAAAGPGRSFVFLHSAASLVGGLWFALAWSGRLSSDKDEGWKRAAPYFVAGAAAVLGAWTMLFSGTLPPMVVANRFTAAAITINFSAGILFLLAACRFILDFKRSGRFIAYFFACLSILFGMSGLLFYYTAVWNPAWWLHHLLRLIAYGAVLVFVIYQYNRDKNATIDAQRAANEELRLKSDLLDSATDSIFLLDPEGNFIYCNETTYRSRGYSKAELMGMNLKQLITPENAPLVGPRITKLLENGKMTFESAHIMKDGSVMPVEVNARPIEIENKKYILSINRDVTERKRCEAEYGAILNTTMDGFWITDLSGNFTDVNEAYCRLIGYSREELLAMNITDVEVCENSEQTAEHIRKIIAIGHDRFETRHRCKDGRIVDIEISVDFLPVDGGRFIVFIRDITDRKNSEQELFKKHSELSVLLDISIAVSRSIDMKKLLADIMDTITGLEILNIERKGGIFIIEGDRMELVYHLGHTEAFLDLHKDMKLGDCLCGLAAKTGEIIISGNSSLDDRHTIKYPEMTPHGHVIIPLKAKERVLGIMYLYVPADIEIDEEKLRLLLSIGNQIGLSMENAKLYEETKSLSLHDPLTKLANRHFFNEIIERETALIKRSGRNLSFIMIDLDHFKKINDTLGHLAGDRILIEAANLIRNTVRGADMVFRYGGDEFLALLTNADRDETKNLVKRLLEAVETWNADNAAAFGCSLSFSLGCSTYRKECDIDAAIKEADEKMYQSKNEKRLKSASVKWV